MDDILLFRWLRERRLDEPRLPALLESFAAASIRQRVAFLGLLGPVLEHPEAAMRALGQRLLRGAKGQLGARAIVAGLDDDDAGVREAALSSLSAISEGQPARWAHALFHRRPEVRALAASGKQPEGAGWMRLYLLADPACSPQLRALLPGSEGEAQLEASPGARAAVLDMARRGMLSRAEARATLAAMGWGDLAEWASRSRRRSPAAVSECLSRAERGEQAAQGEAGEGDDLDALVGLFWAEGDEQAEASSSASFFERLGNALVGQPDALAHRVAASTLALWVSKGRPAPGVPALLAEIYPRSLAFGWVDRATRRAAVQALYDRGSAARKIDPDEVQALLSIDLCRHPDGGLDLWVVGGLLRLLPHGSPYEALMTWLGEGPVLDALARRLGEALPLFALPCQSPEGRKKLLALLGARSPELQAETLALMAASAPVDELELLTDVDGPTALALFSALLLLEEKAETALSSKRRARLGALLGPKIGLVRIEALLTAWLSAPGPQPSPLGAYALTALASEWEADVLVARAITLDAGTLEALVEGVTWCQTFPHGKELALAHALASHRSPRVKAWARARLPAEAIERPPVDFASPPSPLGIEQADALATCDEADLLEALAPCFRARKTGVARALSKRPEGPSVPACIGLLASHDALEAIDEGFARHGSSEPAFVASLDRAAVSAIERLPSLPVLGHAFLHRWERHALAFLDALASPAAGGDAASALGGLLSLSSPPLRSAVLSATAHAIGLLAYRDRPRLASLVSEPLLDLLVGELTGEQGYEAAEALLFVHRSAVAAEALGRRVGKVNEALPDMSEAARERIAPWLSMGGLLPPKAHKKPPARPAPEAMVERARASLDLDELEALCESDHPAVVNEAALRLVELGEAGLSRLSSVLERAGEASKVAPIVESTTLWPAGPWLERVRVIPRGTTHGPELGFRVAMALAERGETDRPELIDAAIARANEASDESWFRPRDWARLLDLGAGPRRLALSLAGSSQPHAYLRAIEEILAMADDAEVLSALGAFVEAGTGRPWPLRVRAAERLHRAGDLRGFPVLVYDLLGGEASAKPLLEGAPADLVEALARSFLVAGDAAAPEQVLLGKLASKGVDDVAREKAVELLLAECETPKARKQAAQMVRSWPGRATKLRQVAETFAWGVLRGRELTGRLFRVEMVSGKGLGHTRLNESRIFVSPLPILRREQGGKALVEALVLHELGHHIYHRGEGAEKAWKAAEHEGLFGLLNLVADEHLERNLRGVDAGFGDRLKRLASYAFQHQCREVPVAPLCESLQSRAFEVLTAGRLEVARDPQSVRVESGAVLLQMERSDLSFARFMRALRMGLGNRHGDDDVDRALSLFKGGFRRRTVPELLELARQLRAIFGWQTRLCEMIGGHEELFGDEAEATIFGDELSADEVQAEVERILDPRRDERKEGREGPPGKPWINVSPDAQFDRITRVEKVPFEQALHADYAAKVARLSRQMREYLAKLGLASRPAPRRLQGQRFDRSRALAMVLRGEPRVLVAREPVTETDLFLGLIIDCSGSMQAQGNIEKAKLFAVLLAEAARGLGGVDVRVFGFTDRVVYDAGDAARCAAHALKAGGGNNDAAALYHAANEARMSRRKAKVLVMISDGLPTECSVTALRALVSTLGKRERMCCAQVAVAPLAEVCFPHYVEIGAGTTDEAVRRFGTIVAGLVKKTLAG